MCWCPKSLSSSRQSIADVLRQSLTCIGDAAHEPERLRRTSRRRAASRSNASVSEGAAAEDARVEQGGCASRQSSAWCHGGRVHRRGRCLHRSSCLSASAPGSGISDRLTVAAANYYPPSVHAW